MTIQYGDLVNCSIETVGDTDSFQFAGRPGDHVIIQAHSTSSGSAACLVVNDPDAAQVASDSYGASSAVDLMSDMVVNYRDPVVCDRPISPASTDTFRFDATNGDSVVVRAVRLAGGGTPCLTLKDPSGTTLSDPTCSTNATVTANLTTTGSHRVEVSKSGASDAIIYVVGVHCAPRSCAN